VLTGERVVEALSGNLGKVMVGYTREAAGLDGGDRGRSQAAEGLPHHVARVGDGVKNAVHELQWLLVEVRRRQTARAVNPGCGPFHRSLNPLRAV
jgi:hypothetical protein